MVVSFENGLVKEGFPSRLRVPVRVAVAVVAVSLVVVGGSTGRAGGIVTGTLSPQEISRLIDAGRYPEAEAAALEVLQAAESADGAESRAACDVRDLLVGALIANGKASEPKTRELADRAVELRLELDGDDALAATESLLNQGRVLKENRQFEEAKEILLRALAIREREFGPNHFEIARVLNELGSVAYRGRNPDLAEARYGQALAMLEATVGVEHPECAVSLTGLFASAILRREYVEAEGFQLRSLEIRKRSLGPDHPLTAVTMRDFGSLLRLMGETERAEDSLRRAVGLFEANLGPEHPQTGSALNSLAILVRDGGGYAEARGLFGSALVAFETSGDPLDPRIAGVLNNLAAVHRELGDFTEAEACLRRSLAIREGRYGADHPAVAQSLGNLANVLIEAERPAEAVPLLERALVIKERAYGRSSVEFAVSLTSLGRACRATGDLDRADRCHVEAVAVLEASLGPDHPMVADQLNNLALVRHEKGELDAARTDLLRAIEIRRVADGEGHPRTGRFYYNLARVEADAGNKDAGIAAALNSEVMGRRHLELTARGLAEDEAIGFDQYTRNRLDLLLAFSLRWPRSATPVWDALIRSRGLVLNELIARRRAAMSDDPVVVALQDELTDATERLARLSVRGSGELSPEAYREELAAANRDVERLERSLGEASAVFRDDQARLRIGFGDVAASLPSGAALVGVTKRSIFTDPVGTRTPDTFDYMAMVLAPGAASPTPVVLGSAPEIDALILAWRKAAVEPGLAKATSSTDEAAYRRTGEALRRRIWDPLAPLIERAETVYVVPDGELGLVNLAALPVGASDYLVEVGPLIHMLDEERDLVYPGGRGFDDGSVLLAVGDPDFDFKANRIRRPGTPALTSGFRGVSGDCGSLDDVVFHRLPSTGLETETIVALWRDCRVGGEASDPSSTCDRSAVRLLGIDATEAGFKRLAPGKTVLHLATHGFVLGGRCEPGVDSGRGIGGLAPSRQKAVLPEQETPTELLGLAGLALTGANRRAEAAQAGEDGVITAMEIANLDLSGVEWAVLSACDTGVGESVSGEGVFGFRRAFRIAGARTVIMSLWPVEDSSSLAWMEFLYRARLEGGMTTAESVRHASREMLHVRREEGRSTHPFYWGAFVAAGDWR